MNNRTTPEQIRTRRSLRAVAGAAILGMLTACGGAATPPAPVGRADSALPSAITPQTANPTPTPSPSPIRTATPAPTVNALAIGDSCLVGRWRLMILRMTDSASVPGVGLALTGQLGMGVSVGAG